MKTTLKRNLFVGFSISLFILLLSTVASYVSISSLLNSARLVNHTNEVIHDLDNVISFVTKAESAGRGYVINNRQAFLSQYYLSRDNTDSTFKRVKSLTADNELQQDNLDTLKALIQARFLWLEKGISIFDSTHKISNDLLAISNEGVDKMIKVENFVHKI